MRVAEIGLGGGAAAAGLANNKAVMRARVGIR
jgi:hypothetical protein